MKKTLILAFMILFAHLYIQPVYGKGTTQVKTSNTVCDFLKSFPNDFDKLIKSDFKKLLSDDSCTFELIDKLLHEYNKTKEQKYIILIDKNICTTSDGALSEALGATLNEYFFNNFEVLSIYLYSNKIKVTNTPSNILTLVAYEETYISGVKEFNARLKYIERFIDGKTKKMPLEKRKYFLKMSKDMRDFIKNHR